MTTDKNAPEEKFVVNIKTRVRGHTLEIDHDIEICVLHNIPGIAYKIPSHSIKKFLDDQNCKHAHTNYCLDKSCVYMFLGKNIIENKEAIYIGETYQFEKRIKSHKIWKDEKTYNWEYILLFFRKDRTFNKGHIDHIEKRLALLLNTLKPGIGPLCGVGKFDGEGKIKPNNQKNLLQENLSHIDRDAANEFLISIILLTQKLDVNIFGDFKNAQKALLEVLDKNKHQTRSRIY